MRMKPLIGTLGFVPAAYAATALGERRLSLQGSFEGRGGPL
jgi:hypothetical protein